MTNKREPKQSQLDYLWTNFGNRKVSNIPGDTPSDEVILTEQAVISFIEQEFAKSNIKFKIDSEVVDNIVTLRFKDYKDTLIDKISFEQGARIIKLNKFISTQSDVDKGYVTRPNILCVELQDSIGQRFFLELSEINHSGSETDSIIVSVVGTKIAAQIKIDNPIVNKAIELKTTTSGLRAELLIDDTSPIILEKGDNGLSARYKWSDESFDVKFKALTTNEYLSIPEPDEGTLYFLTDATVIFFRKIRYGSEANLDELLKRLDDLEAKEVPDNIAQIIDNKINNSLSWEIL